MKTHALLALGLVPSLPSAAGAKELDLDGAFVAGGAAGCGALAAAVRAARWLAPLRFGRCPASAVEGRSA